MKRSLPWILTLSVLALAAVSGAASSGETEAGPSATPEPETCSVEELTQRFSGGGAIEIRTGRLREGQKFLALTIREARPDGPAAEAGLRADDVILSVDGREIAWTEEDHDYFHRLHRDLQEGETVVYRVRRAGEELEIPIVAGPRPPELTAYFVFTELMVNGCPNRHEYKESLDLDEPFLQG